MNKEMTEDDEAKQRAHEVANQSQSLFATTSPTAQNNDKTRGQIGKHSPVIEAKLESQTSDCEVAGEDHETSTIVKDRVADNNKEVTRGEFVKEGVSENYSQNATQDQHEQKCTDRPNSDQQSITPIRQNRRHQHHHDNIHHHHLNNNNNNNNSSPNNHQRKYNSQYTQAAVMSQDGMPAAVGTTVSAEYLAQLIKDKKQLAAFPTTVFLQAPRLVEEEIQRVRQQLFQLNDVVSSRQQPLELPEPDGEFVSLQEKIYVPVDQHPEYNFVGRLLGPRGMTAKQLEQETGCKIMIRGKGSMRDKKKEDQNRGKANWEHLKDDLHVLITVEDTQSRAQIKLGRAIQEVRQLLVPVVDGEDELKKRQLMELAIINGTYRDCNYNEALSKMLNDAAYRQSQLVEHESPTSSGQQQLMANAGATASASSSGSPPSGPLAASRHFQTHLQHYPNSTTASTNLDGSSGFPSTGSTPNSLHHSANYQQVANSGQHPQSRHQSHPHHGPPPTHHHHPGSQHHLSHPTTMAVVAAAAAAAAAQHHQQASVPPQSATNHQQHLHHAHSHQSPAVAAAAAAAALMSNPAAEANAILYAQQYHDFQHYAAMAAVAAASHQPILPPPPLDYNPHHPHHAYPPPPPHHPNPHHHHAAVAQAVAAATAANQQFHRQIAEQQIQQHNAEALANTNEMVNYHQQEQQIDNGNDQNDFQNLPLIEESSGMTSEHLSDQQQHQLKQEHASNQ